MALAGNISLIVIAVILAVSALRSMGERMRANAERINAGIPGPDVTDYLSDILGELESGRAVMEAIQNAIERRR